jgi:hypothetical protein
MDIVFLLGGGMMKCFQTDCGDGCTTLQLCETLLNCMLQKSEFLARGFYLCDIVIYKIYVLGL